MLISPEVYYEYTLKEMNEKQLMTEIRALKREIGHIKKVLEHPEIRLQYFVEPIRLDYDREYLEQAKIALGKVGGNYVPSKAELKAQEFEDNTNAISKIEFLFGDFFEGYNQYIIEFDGDKMEVSKERMCEKTSFKLTNKSGQIVDKKGFLKIMKELHMGEWKAHYSSEHLGHTLLDGIHWEVVIQYTNGRKKVRFTGDDACPYNFKEFSGMFGI